PPWRGGAASLLWPFDSGAGAASARPRGSDGGAARVGGGWRDGAGARSRRSFAGAFIGVFAAGGRPPGGGPALAVGRAARGAEPRRAFPATPPSPKLREEAPKRRARRVWRFASSRRHAERAGPNPTSKPRAWPRRSVSPPSRRTARRLDSRPAPCSPG